MIYEIQSHNLVSTQSGDMFACHAVVEWPQPSTMIPTTGPVRSSGTPHPCPSSENHHVIIILSTRFVFLDWEVLA